MNPTWGEILFELRVELNEPKPAFFSDDGLMSLYNRAANQFALKTEIIEGTVEIPIEPDLITAILPASLSGIKAVRVISNDSDGPFIYPASEKSSSLGSELLDEIRYFKGGSSLTLTEKIGLDDLIRVVYWGKNIPFADSTDISAEGSISDEWTGAVIQGALWYAFRKRKDFQDAAAALNDFKEGVRDARLFTKYHKGPRQLNINE